MIANLNSQRGRLEVIVGNKSTPVSFIQRILIWCKSEIKASLLII